MPLMNMLLNGFMNGEGAASARVRHGVVGLPDGVACLALLAMERLALPHPGGVDEPLMTADQVVALLPVLRSSVYDYARRTDVPLPSVRIGWHRRFLRSEVMAWLRALPRT